MPHLQPSSHSGYDGVVPSLRPPKGNEVPALPHMLAASPCVPLRMVGKEGTCKAWKRPSVPLCVGDDDDWDSCFSSRVQGSNTKLSKGLLTE